MAEVLPHARPALGAHGDGVSQAELDVLDALEQLPDDWIVLHSLWLKTHRVKVHAEADFLVITDRAALILEVKGGDVWRENDGWHFRTKSGSHEDVKREGPLDQARGAYYAIRSHLEEHRRRDLFDDHVWGYGAIFPECVQRFDSRDTATDPELVLDITRFPKGVRTFVDGLTEYWSARLTGQLHHLGRRAEGLRALSMNRRSEICEFLRPEMEKVVGIGVEVASAERELIRLTDRQLAALDYASAEPRNLLIGTAGTGKTVLAVEQARRMAESGARVLFVCFNSLLAGRIRMDLLRKGAASVTALNYHQLAVELVKRSGQQLPASEDWDQFETWLHEAAIGIVAGYQDSDKFDYLVVDEAQDLMSATFVDLLDCLLVDGLARGRWLVALDMQQAIFKKNFDQETFEKLGSMGRKMLLELNCRNTRPIAAYVRAVSGAGSVSTKATTGEIPVVRYFSDSGAYGRLVKKVVNDLIRGFEDAGYPPSDIVLLTADNRYVSEEMLKPGFFLRPLRKVRHDDADSGEVRFATVQGFKGLEARAIVLVGFERFDTEAVRELFYVGASRARAALRILLPEACDHMHRVAAELAKYLQGASDSQSWVSSAAAS